MDLARAFVVDMELDIKREQMNKKVDRKYKLR